MVLIAIVMGLKISAQNEKKKSKFGFSNQWLCECQESNAGLKIPNSVVFNFYVVQAIYGWTYVTVVYGHRPS